MQNWYGHKFRQMRLQGGSVTRYRTRERLKTRTSCIVPFSMGDMLLRLSTLVTHDKKNRNRCLGASVYFGAVEVAEVL